MPRQLRIVRDHDHQPLPCDLFDQIHDLNAGFSIQRPRRLIRKQDLRIVHKRPCDRNPLHLPARKLVRLLVQLCTQPHSLQRFRRPQTPFLHRYARQRERQLYIPEHRLVRYQIIRLEHKSDTVIPIRIPISVFIMLRRNALDHKIARSIFVQPAYNVQQRRLATSRCPQNGNKLFLPKTKTDSLQSMNNRICYLIVLRDSVQFQYRLRHNLILLILLYRPLSASFMRFALVSAFPAKPRRMHLKTHSPSSENPRSCPHPAVP